MKKILFILLLAFSATTFAQTGIGTTTPNASAQLDVSSTTKGFLPPRMTTVQKNAISSPVEGLVVYDTNLDALCAYDGTAWKTVGGGPEFCIGYFSTSASPLPPVITYNSIGITISGTNLVLPAGKYTAEVSMQSSITIGTVGTLTINTTATVLQRKIGDLRSYGINSSAVPSVDSFALIESLVDNKTVYFTHSNIGYPGSGNTETWFKIVKLQ